MPYGNQKETHEIHLYQRISPSLINSRKHGHSGFFAITGSGRRTVLDNATNTGIQIGPAAMNTQFPSRKHNECGQSRIHGLRNWIPVFSRPGTRSAARPFSTAKNRNDTLFLDS
jgi:hypothetical protein